jgi:hypothetical protein
MRDFGEIQMNVKSTIKLTGKNERVTDENTSNSAKL